MAAETAPSEAKGVILGLTVHDNDFQDLLLDFADKIGMGRIILESPPTDPAEERRRWYDWYRKTEQTCRRIFREGCADEAERQLLFDVIRRSWTAYVAVHEPERKDYLTGRLEITLPESIDATWRNGEQIYLFPSSYAGRRLCF